MQLAGSARVSREAAEERLRKIGHLSTSSSDRARYSNKAAPRQAGVHDAAQNRLQVIE